jgi:hypothetical protein
MKRSAALLVGTIVTATTLSGCGGGSAYCDAASKNKAALEGFGKTRTDAAFAKLDQVIQSMAKTSPTAVRKDWQAIGDGLKGVIAAQKKVNLRLEDVNAKSAAKLTTAQQKSLNTSYTAFNSAVQNHGAVVVKNVKQECKIVIK